MQDVQRILAWPGLAWPGLARARSSACAWKARTSRWSRAYAMMANDGRCWAYLARDKPVRAMFRRSQGALLRPRLSPWYGRPAVTACDCARHCCIWCIRILVRARQLSSMGFGPWMHQGEHWKAADTTMKSNISWFTHSNFRRVLCPLLRHLVIQVVASPRAAPCDLTNSPVQSSRR